MSFQVTCPCGRIIEADDEEGLVPQVRAHASAHDLDLSHEQVLEMAESV